MIQAAITTLMQTLEHASKMIRKHAKKDVERGVTEHQPSSVSHIKRDPPSDRFGSKPDGFASKLKVGYFRIRNRPIEYGLIAAITCLLLIVIAVASDNARPIRVNANARIVTLKEYPRIVQSSQPFRDIVAASDVPLVLPEPGRLLRRPMPNELPYNDRQYERYRYEPESEDTECDFIEDWQRIRESHPTCNALHEMGLEVAPGSTKEVIRHLASGGFKDVWAVYDDPKMHQKAGMVLKTQLYDHQFRGRDWDKHRRDAIVMERTSASPYILNMYSYCAFSSLVESAPRTLEDWIEEDTMSSLEMIQVATDVATSIRDMHMFHNGMATIAHADIKASQFLLPKGESTYKLNDFNRCKFLTSEHPPDVCPFTIGTVHKGSTSRAPEEYAEGGLQTDKIDVFSMGSLFYHMLTGDPPFRDRKFDDAMDSIVEGKDLVYPDEVTSSHDKNMAALVEIITWCREYKAKDRPTSEQVATRMHKILGQAKAREKARIRGKARSG